MLLFLWLVKIWVIRSLALKYWALCCFCGVWDCSSTVWKHSQSVFSFVGYWLVVKLDNKFGNRICKDMKLGYFILGLSDYPLRIFVVKQPHIIICSIEPFTTIGLGNSYEKWNCIHFLSAITLAKIWLLGWGPRWIEPSYRP